jgi:DHA3 family tetracycline resistance protein-like MFS transporter
MLGRVSSLDWLISIGLLPLSFALTAPVAAAVGAQTTLVAAGLTGAVVTLAALLLPGMFDVERPRAEPVPIPAGEPARRSRRSTSEAA